LITEKRTSFNAKIVKLKLNLNPHAWHPPTDLLETEDSFIIRTEIAGMSASDFSVNIDEDFVTIIGKRSLTNRKCAFHRMEILYGDFTVRIALPDEVDVDAVSAEYDTGFLTIFLPKAKTHLIKLDDHLERK